MALISIAEWIDRFGKLEEAGEAVAMHSSDPRSNCARDSTVPRGLSPVRHRVGAFLKEYGAIGTFRG